MQGENAESCTILKSVQILKKDLPATPSPSTLIGVETITQRRLERMLAMSDINCIKHWRNTKGLSISEIQKTLGINWRTAKNYADDNQCDC